MDCCVNAEGLGGASVPRDYMQVFWVVAPDGCGRVRVSRPATAPQEPQRAVHQVPSVANAEMTGSAGPSQPVAAPATSCDDAPRAAPTMTAREDVAPAAAGVAPTSGEPPAGELQQERLERLLHALSLMPPQSSAGRLADLEDLTDAMIGLPPSADAIAGRLTELVGWELNMLRAPGGRSDRALHGLRNNITIMLRRLVQTLAGDTFALAVASPHPGKPRGRRGYRVAYTESMAMLLRDASAPSPSEGPKPKARPMDAWSAAGLVDTRQNYPLLPPRRGINGGLPGVY